MKKKCKCADALKKIKKRKKPKQKSDSDKSDPSWRLSYFISLVVPLCDRVFTQCSSILRLYQIPFLPNQLSPDMICFITELVRIDDSSGGFHSSHCATEACAVSKTLGGRRKNSCPLSNIDCTDLNNAESAICTARADKVFCTVINY